MKLIRDFMQALRTLCDLRFGFGNSKKIKQFLSIKIGQSKPVNLWHFFSSSFVGDSKEGFAAHRKNSQG